jgi:uncharacterized protein (TIGR02217 family)
MAFVEERFLDCVSYGTVGGPTWLTRKVGLRSGIIRRNPLRSRPLYRFNIIYKNLLPEDHAEVIGAFNACFGGVHSFRLKDWSDFEATDELLSVLGTGSSQTLQLTKIYSFGNINISRPIRKPVAGTVVITDDNVPIAATVDYTTGMATFTASSGGILRWSGEFDVPVMFEDDQLSFSIDNRSAQGFFLTSDVALMEDIAI